MQTALDEEEIESQPNPGSARKRGRFRDRKRVRFDLFKDEYEQITSSAQEAGLSVMEYCRRLCLGQKIRNRFDYDTAETILRVNADLARLGNLLNQAIAKEVNHLEKSRIRSIINDINKTQTLMKNIVADL
jgi:hypothetical protein